MFEALQNLSPEARQSLIGALVGIATLCLQYIATRWPAWKWLAPTSSSTQKRLTALFGTVLACVVVGQFTATDLVGLLNTIFAGYSTNQGLYAAVRSLLKAGEGE